jgi:hypothetical protein
MNREAESLEFTKHNASSVAKPTRDTARRSAEHRISNLGRKSTRTNRFWIFSYTADLFGLSTTDNIRDD